MRNFSIKPTGALRRFLETQMDGLTGNIEAAGYPFNLSTWGNPDYVPREPVTWWPFQQTGYYIDGLTRCAIMLEDKDALEKAEKIIYGAIDNADIPHIEIEARRVPLWKLRPRRNLRCWNRKFETVVRDGPYTFTPRLPNMKKAAVSPEAEKIKLYPHGASKLRMTVLPITDK